MSTSYDFYCHDCHKESDMERSDTNHRYGLLVKLLEHKDAIAEVASIKGLYEEACLTVDQVWIDFKFFAEHKGHKLGVISEYGEIVGMCGWEAQSRKEYFSCNLPPGHEGEHRK